MASNPASFDGEVEDLPHTTAADLALTAHHPSLSDSSTTTTNATQQPNSTTQITNPPPLSASSTTQITNPVQPLPGFASSQTQSVTTAIPLSQFSLSSTEPWVQPPRSRFPNSVYERGSSSHPPPPVVSGIDQLTATLQALDFGVYAPVLGGHGGSSTSPPALPSSFNVTSIVTNPLHTVEDYLTWRTQFLTLLLSHGLLPYVDGSYPPPPASVVGPDGHSQGNPNFYSWIRVDQTLKSWLFATIHRDIVIEVRDLVHAYQIWDRLHHRFVTASLAKSLELKRKLTNLKKTDGQSMEAYLREIKVISDSLAAIDSPLTDRELVEFTIFGLDDKYETMITAATYFGSHLSFDDLRSKLIMYEQRVLHLQESSNGVVSHQAFAATTPSGQSSSSNSSGTSQSASTQSNNRGGGRGGRGRGNGNRGRGGRGRGRYNNNNGQQGGNNSGHNPRSPATVPGTNSTASGMSSSNSSYIALSAQTTPPVLPSVSTVSANLSPPSLVVCQLCFNPGHSAPFCPRFFPNGATGAPAASSHAFSAMQSGEANDAVWYPDSAASAHMTITFTITL